MSKGRLEGFSDGVLAIIITIMVLELRPPHEARLTALHPLLPIFVSYLLSFAFLAIYWSNHHHLLQAVTRVNGRVLWANLHLIFWLSLIPFVTAWMGENEFAAAPVALYGTVLLLAAVAYFILTRALISLHGGQSSLAHAVGRDRKGKVSVLIYLVAIPLAFVSPWPACALYVVVVTLWLVPDRRIERALGSCSAPAQRYLGPGLPHMTRPNRTTVFTPGHVTVSITGSAAARGPRGQHFQDTLNGVPMTRPQNRSSSGRGKTRGGKRRYG